MYELLKIFEPDAVLTDDIWGYLWGKLAYGAMLFGTALTPDSMSANFADPSATPGLAGARPRGDGGRGTRAGVTPRGFGELQTRSLRARRAGRRGARRHRLACRLHEPDRQDPFRHLSRPRRPQAQDRGRSPRSGSSPSSAREQGLPTPALDRLVALIHDVEDGRRPLAFETLNALIATCRSASTDRVVTRHRRRPGHRARHRQGLRRRPARACIVADLDEAGVQQARGGAAGSRACGRSLGRGSGRAARRSGRREADGRLDVLALAAAASAARSGARSRRSRKPTGTRCSRRMWTARSGSPKPPPRS